MLSIKNNLKDLLQEFPSLRSIAERLCPGIANSHKSLDEISGHTGISMDFLEMLFNAYLSNSLPSPTILNRFPIGNYLLYIQLTHQYYLNKKLPQLDQHLQALSLEYKDTNIILYGLGHQFQFYKQKLVEHIEEEDGLLIPYIQELIAVLQSYPWDTEKIQKILGKKVLQSFATEHSDVESDLMKTRKLIVQYSSPQKMPIAHRILLRQMESFEYDLTIHSQLEDQVILPKARLLEDLLRGSLTASGFRMP